MFLVSLKKIPVVVDVYDSDQSGVSSNEEFDEPNYEVNAVTDAEAANVMDCLPLFTDRRFLSRE